MTQSYIPFLLLSPLERRCDPSFQHILVPFTQGYYVTSLVEIGQVVVLEKKFLKVVNDFLYVAIISPLKKNAWPFIRTNLNSLYPRILCVMFGWNWPRGSGEDFEKLSIFFLIFAIISPYIKGKSFIWKKLNPFNQRMFEFCAKFGWNWQGGSGELFTM